MLLLEITQREVKSTSKENCISGSKKFFKCKINFDKFWEGFQKHIVFKRSSELIAEPYVIIAHNMTEEIEIPFEILKDSGSFKIGVYGIKDGVILPTLWSEDFIVECGTDTCGKAPAPPTPTVYEQIIKTTNEAVKIAQSVRDDADSGKFNGGNVTTDLEYNPESTNPQSGVAVAHAVKNSTSPEKIAEALEGITFVFDGGNAFSSGQTLIIIDSESEEDNNV